MRGRRFGPIKGSPLRRPVVRPVVALRLALLCAVGAVAQTAYPSRGAAGDVDGDPFYEFETQPDSSVLIRSNRGDSLRIEPYHLRQIAAAYGGDLTGADADVRGGFDVQDGAVQLYYARRIPVWVALAALGVLGALAVAFAVWALRRIARDARRKAELQAYRETLASARENERLRLAREIHDGPLQALHALRLRAADPDAEADLLASIRELRRIIEGLRPPDLDRYSLADAVGALVQRFEAAYPAVEVTAHVRADDGAVERYDEAVRLAIYRLAQEALNNAGEHAGAHCVGLTFDAGPERYRLEVEDDGVGFDPDTPPDGDRSHFGLVGMAERAEAVAADLAVVSKPGHGTRLRLEGVPSRP